MPRHRAVAALCLSLLAGPTVAQGTAPVPETVIREYCANIRDEAVDARLAWQSRTLKELEAQVAERIARLEEKKAEYEEWVSRREALLERANAQLVAIYGGMRPDAAALQLAELDPATAAALIASLGARNASAIMAEMAPEQAAQLSLTLAGEIAR